MSEFDDEKLGVKKENLILNMTFDFSLQVIDFCESLQSNGKYSISNQLIRSGCSIGANVKEAQNAESKSDFIHKMKIAAKEAGESEYWLLLCKHSKNYPFEESLIKKLDGIILVLNKIIGTTKRSMKK